MKALLVESAEKIKWVDIGKPVMEDSDDVVIKVRAAGICGTDFHIVEGSHGAVQYPMIPGHELVGEVVERGDDVGNIAVGDRVAVDPVVSCGECHVCRSGRHNICCSVKCLGVQTNGGFCEYIKIKAGRLYSFSDNLSWEKAALTEPFSIAAHISNRLRIDPEDKVLVIGSGTIGLSLLQVIGRVCGAEVAVADISPEKLEMADRFSASFTINSARQSAVSKCIEVWEGCGPNVIVDAAGSTPIMEDALRHALPGSRIGNIGFMSEPMSIQPVEITKRELEVIGSRMNNEKFPQVLKWLEEGVLEPETMISHRFDFDDAQEAFEVMKDKSKLTCKIILTFNRG